ncbi:MAG: pilin [Patescibacteria group bacterium]
MRLLPFFALFLLFAALLVPGEAGALNLQYPEVGPPGGSIDLDELTPKDALPKLISWAFYLVVSIAGLVAFLVIVWAGVQWLTSAGNPTTIADARDRIGQALLGLVFVLGSVLFIRLIAPAALEIPLFDVPQLPETEFTSPLQSSNIALEANGEPDVLVIPPGEEVALAWDASGLQNCQSGSTPDESLWTGDQESVGAIILPPLSTNQTFRLLCDERGGSSLSAIVRIVISSDDGGIGPVPEIDIKIDGEDGPLTPGLIPTLTWEGNWIEGDPIECLAPEELSSFSTSAPTGEYRFTVSGMFPGTYNYTFVCTNTTTGTFASDTVVVVIP